jgi:hypothetical protein
VLVNLNPNGWNKAVRWEMMYGLDAVGGALGHDAQALLAGDSEGRLHVLDPRAGSIGSSGGASGSGASGGGGRGAAVAVALLHKAKTRICSVAAQPLGAPKAMTAGARAWARDACRGVSAGASCPTGCLVGPSINHGANKRDWVRGFGLPAASCLYGARER